MTVKLGEGLSMVEQRMVQEMEKLAWEAMRKADPTFAEDYWNKIQSIRIAMDSQFLAEEELLRRTFTSRYEVLQTQNKVPDFFALRGQAMKNLHMRPSARF